MSTLLAAIFPSLAKLTPVEQAFAKAETVEELELLLLHFPQLEIPSREFVEAGVYAKEIFIPKGTFAIGHAHPSSFLQVVSAGKMLMFSEGHDCEVVTAPFTGPGLPNYRKVGYALEDTIWTTFHACDASEASEDYKASLISPSKAFQDFQAAEVDRTSFQEALEAIGVSKEVADFETLHNAPLQETELPVETRPSAIHGLGCFTTEELGPQDALLARDALGKTLVGRYTNHGKSPNCEAFLHEERLMFKPTSLLSTGTELTVDYTQVQKICLEELCPQ